MIQIEKLTIRYDELFALNSVSLELETGKIHGVIGPNGAGKSTLIKACAGLISAYSGSIIFEGKNIRDERSWRKDNCAYAPEDVELLPYLKGYEFLQLIGSIRRTDELESKIDSFLQMLDLKSKQDELITDLSHGMRQKLAVAATLIGDTRYMLFDETLNGLDTRSLNHLKKYFRAKADSGKTILLSSHVLPLVRDWCDSVIVLDAGKISNILEAADIKNWSATDFPL